MSPRTGRPTKESAKKSVSLQLRITQEKAQELQECADRLSVSRTEVIEQGISLVLETLKDE